MPPTPLEDFEGSEIEGRQRLPRNPLAARASGIDRFWSRLSRLWSLSLVFNLAGGAVLTLILTTEGALPQGVPGALVEVAERWRAETPGRTS